MSSLAAVLSRAIRDLTLAEARFALVGGLAVSARAEPRLTRDIDLAVAVSDDREAEAVVWRMQRRGYRVTMTVEQRRVRRLATARLVPEGENVLVDLLFASSGIEPEVVAAATPLEILPGVAMPIATAGHLVAMKVLSYDGRARPQDHDDALALLRVEGQAALAEARSAIRTISARGFDRGRDLESLLDGLWALARRDPSVQE